MVESLVHLFGAGALARRAFLLKPARESFGRVSVKLGEVGEFRSFFESAERPLHGHNRSLGSSFGVPHILHIKPNGLGIL